MVVPADRTLSRASSGTISDFLFQVVVGQYVKLVLLVFLSWIHPCKGQHFYSFGISSCLGLWFGVVQFCSARASLRPGGVKTATCVRFANICRSNIEVLPLQMGWSSLFKGSAVSHMYSITSLSVARQGYWNVGLRSQGISWVEACMLLFKFVMVFHLVWIHPCTGQPFLFCSNHVSSSERNADSSQGFVSSLLCSSMKGRGLQSTELMHKSRK